MIPIVFHVPHWSTRIPKSYRAQMLLSDAALERELLAMTDAFTHEFARLRGRDHVRRVKARVSRLLCDVERYRSDEMEGMSAVGMGAVYTRTSDRQPLRSGDERLREHILRRYYDPHHERLAHAVSESLDEQGACLIVDMHSFPSVPLPYEVDQTDQRPEICLGFDSFHGRFLADGGWREVCQSAGIANAAANRPFGGSIVPAKCTGNPAVMSVMIEIRRDLYMDENTGQKLPTFAWTSANVRRLVKALAERAESQLTEEAAPDKGPELRVPPSFEPEVEPLLQAIMQIVGPEKPIRAFTQQLSEPRGLRSHVPSGMSVSRNS
jgi:N-formylglutamate deformylase